MPRYTLMNMNRRVLDFDYSLDLHAAVKVRDVHDLRYAPPAILDRKGMVTRRNLNEWWRNRAIPASRHHIDELLETLQLDSTLELAERNFGLSLSDRYWLNDSENPQRWEDVNFFDNDFTDELGVMTLGQSLSENPSLMSPNATLGGDLSKKWKCMDGKRILLKAGTGIAQQEVANEVIATELHSRLLEPGEAVRYWVVSSGGELYSACENMLEGNEELITARDIMATRTKPNDMNEYRFLIEAYRQLGFDDAERKLEKMFVCDYILANQDRHWRNFGVLRDAGTLEYTRIAPIYDNGTCLWCRSYALDLSTGYIAKPFGRRGMEPDRQLALFTDWSWFDPSKLGGFQDDVVSLLSQNRNLSPERIELIGRKVAARIETVTNWFYAMNREHIDHTR